ncbi:MAG: hypothetical protein WC406_04240 [Methanoregula sp.]
MPSDVHLVWILDHSNSMKAKGKINSVNMVIRETIPLVLNLSQEFSSYHFFMRALAFSNGAHWIDPHVTRIEDYTWTDLEAGGRSDFGAALQKIREMWGGGSNGSEKPGVFFFVLLTDGHPTDDWQESLQDLFEQKFFLDSKKIAITLQDTDNGLLEEFIGHKKTEHGFIINVDEIEQIPMSIVSCIEQ